MLELLKIQQKHNICAHTQSPLESHLIIRLLILACPPPKTGHWLFVQAAYNDVCGHFKAADLSGRPGPSSLCIPMDLLIFCKVILLILCN